MTLYLKMDFDTQMRKFSVKKLAFDFDDTREGINMEDFPAFKDIKNSGQFFIWGNPLEIKRWFDGLKEDKRGNVLFWDGGCISLPGNTIEEYITD